MDGWQASRERGNMTNFGKSVKIIRIEKNSKSKDFAEFMGCSLSYVSAMENGKKPITIAYLRKLIEYYSLSVDEINGLLDAISLDYRENVRKKLLGDEEI